MVCCRAAVLNSQNRPIAGISVSLSVEACMSIGEEKIVQSMQDISKKISIRLGAEL
jgi:DNA-binding IclR family transcriptional regulator